MLSKFAPVIPTIRGMNGNRRKAGPAMAGIAAIGVALAAFVADARAEVASDWGESLSSRARLLAGEVSTETGSKPFAGIEIRLDEGWKTYWRNPGDAGIPPRFDWSGSENLAEAEVLYPAPHRLPDPGGVSIGYKRQVVFPVRLTPADPAKPIRISLKLEYGACATLCVPAEADLRLTMPASVAAPSPAIAEALGRVPRQTDGEADLPRVSELSLTGEGDERRIAVTVMQPRGADEADLFVEGPASWYLPVPVPEGVEENGAGIEIAYEIPLDGVPKKAVLEGETLRLTVVNGADAVEQQWTLR